MDLKAKRIKWLKRQRALGTGLDVFDCASFTEITGNNGGEVIVYRIYGESSKNFKLTAR